MNVCQLVIYGVDVRCYWNGNSKFAAKEQRLIVRINIIAERRHFHLCNVFYFFDDGRNDSNNPNVENAHCSMWIISMSNNLSDFGLLGTDTDADASSTLNCFEWKIIVFPLAWSVVVCRVISTFIFLPLFNRVVVQCSFRQLLGINVVLRSLWKTNDEMNHR